MLKDIYKPVAGNITVDSNLGDGRLLRIFKCRSKRCELKHFKARDKVESTCTKRLYDCVTPPGTVYLNCHSTNLIYLITCSTCGLQYVGETVQPLSARFNGQHKGIKDTNKY